MLKKEQSYTYASHLGFRGILYGEVDLLTCCLNNKTICSLLSPHCMCASRVTVTIISFQNSINDLCYRKLRGLQADEDYPCGLLRHDTAWFGRRVLILRGTYYLDGSRDSSVSTLTRLWAGRSGVRLLAKARVFSSQGVLTSPGGPPSLLFKWLPVILFWG